jgi:pimeloyl-ACP methyl ester carboxylesterase
VLHSPGGDTSTATLAKRLPCATQRDHPFRGLSSGWLTSSLVQVASGDLSLHVADDGDPLAPPILLVHGIIGSRATWSWLVGELAERFRVLRLDLRGHGLSDRAPGRYAADGYVADAIAALEQAAGRPCVIVGHSLGGAIAATIAQRRPDLLVGAVLEDPPLGPMTAGDAVALEGHALLDGFRFLREAIPQVQAAEMSLEDLVAVISATPHSSGSGTFGDVLVADGVTSMASSLLEVDATVLDPVLTGTTGSFLDPVLPFAVPTLVIAADPAQPDAVASPAAVEHYVAMSSTTEAVVVDGAGHAIHNERAGRDGFRAALLTFLDRHPSR